MSTTVSLVDILHHRRLDNWETRPSVYDLLTRPLTEAFEDGPSPNGLPWVRAFDPTTSLRAAHEVGTWRASRVSVIAPVIPVYLTIQLHLRATKSDPSQISEIEVVTHKIHSRIRFVLNRFSPINRRLPLEVLGVIPSFLIRDRDRIIVTHICRHWRNAFLSTPSLWSDISAFEHPEKTEAYLKRSGDTSLNTSIATNKLRTGGAISSFQMLNPILNRCRTATLLNRHTGTDIIAIMKNSCPRLVELYLEISGGMTFHGIEDLSGFPLLRSLTLIGDTKHLRFSQPFNLRKLGVSHSGREFRLPSLLQLLAKIPLLEEFEVTTTDPEPTIVKADAITPVVLKHLQRIVFRGIRSEFPRTLSTLVTYPNHTKIILTHHLPNATLNSPGLDPRTRMFPSGMELPTISPPKHIRCRDVQDNDSSETKCCIDLISVDGQHISIESCYGWPDGFASGKTEGFTLEVPHAERLGFLRTLDLSFVERFCVEMYVPDPGLIGEVMGGMVNLATLVVVDGYPCGVLTGLEVSEPPAMTCPLLRRLVVRQDLGFFYMDWRMLLPIMEGRAAHGSPFERVTLTSSFKRLPAESKERIEQLERIAEVTYDYGRNTFGWEWWKV